MACSEAANRLTNDVAEQSEAGQGFVLPICGSPEVLDVSEVELLLNVQPAVKERMSVVKPNQTKELIKQNNLTLIPLQLHRTVVY